MRIRLYTRDWHDVVLDREMDGTYGDHPEVLIWEARMFVLVTAQEDTLTYREARTLRLDAPPPIGRAWMLEPQ